MFAILLFLTFEAVPLQQEIKDENIMDILKRFLFVITAIVVIAILFVPLMLIQFPIVLGIGLYQYIVKSIPVMRVFAEHDMWIETLLIFIKTKVFKIGE